MKDRIAAMAQGEDEFEDVVDKSPDKVVEKIRDQKDTIVKLKVLSAARGASILWITTHAKPCVLHRLGRSSLTQFE